MENPSFCPRLEHVVLSWFADYISICVGLVLGHLWVPAFPKKGFKSRIGCYCMYWIAVSLSVLLMPLLSIGVALLPSHPYSKAQGMWKTEPESVLFLQDNRDENEITTWKVSNPVPGELRWGAMTAISTNVQAWENPFLTLLLSAAC